MAVTLRTYQSEQLERTREALRRHRRVILQAPTGSGKTVLTVHMIAAAASRGLSAWFLVHRGELLEQTSAALSAQDVPHGRIVAGQPITAERVQVASVQTLVRRLDKLAPPNLVVVDECHHAMAASYRRILEHCPRSWSVGLTATPARADGQGLGDLYEAIVPGPSVADLVAAGHLARYRIIAPPVVADASAVRVRAGDYEREALAEVVDRRAVVGDAIGHWRRFLGPGQTTLVYCVSRAHARHVEEAYREAGVGARYCAGDTPADERTGLIAAFRRREVPVLVSVDLFGEGLDVPGLDAVQLMRPTQSLVLHLQQIGRALRPEPGKVALILDHVGNTYRHGLPDDDREWSLEGRKRRPGDGEAAPRLSTCEACFAVFPTGPRVCPACGAELARAAAALPDTEAGDLVEIDPEEHRRLRRVEEGRAGTLAELQALGRARGYKSGWAWQRWQARQRRRAAPAAHA